MPTKRITLTLESKVAASLAKMAKDQGQTPSELVSNIILGMQKMKSDTEFRAMRKQLSLSKLSPNTKAAIGLIKLPKKDRHKSSKQLLEEARLERFGIKP